MSGSSSDTTRSPIPTPPAPSSQLNTGIRIRSRSPRWRRYRSNESVGDCIICFEAVKLRDAWQCLQCEAVLHISCVPTNAYGRLTLTQGGGRGGCPLCGITLTQAISTLTASTPAPFGAMCQYCKRNIGYGQLMNRCVDSRRNCLAVWHPICRPHHATRCPGCDLTVFEAIRNRRY